MAEDTEDETREDGVEGEEGEEEAKKGGLKKMILFIGLPVILVILAGVAGALFFLGGGEEEVVAEGEHGEAHGEASADGHGDGHAEEEAHLAELFRFEEPLIVDMSGPDNRSVLLEVQIALAYSDHDVGEMLAREDVQMLLRDEYVEFFRALRVEDIDGSTGSHRIRMELIRRTNLVLAPKTVDGVLLPSFVMQQ
ncbi:flagellar basal body-associated protein FliL [Oceanicaulis sp. MMSF_3324]|uniref:flagellar basal body-associated FliL family protein n=1 Tax=Oceanicaulis sp. MMSF_3324 TaxID=3046702 RepID=UPI00273EC882|nr:flagellar basal body-associated FliL family protein [Oceanicaulis sp. MMSF_3324]